MTTKTADDIKQLVDRFRRAMDSDKNRRNRRRWRHWPPAAGRWEERPAPDGQFPITIEPEAPLWAEMLGFSLVTFYTDPAEYVRRNLQMALWRFEHWDEDTPLEPALRIWMGVTFEASLFGAETRYGEGFCPWLAGEKVVTSPEDLDRLARPDFRNSGLMPRAHAFYEQCRQLLPDDFHVEFPDWERSPFGVATHLRGTEDILMDLVADPDFARRQIHFLTDCRKQWVADRGEYLGQPVQPGVLLNDEVNGALFPPKYYEELILPSEVELAEYQGITYWHSCGEMTAFVPLIHRIPGLRIYHVSPWTDVGTAAGAMDGVALQCCLDPVKDVQRAGDEHIRRRTNEIAAACGHKAFTIRADGLHVIDSVEREIQAIDRWLVLAREARDQRARAS